MSLNRMTAWILIGLLFLFQTALAAGEDATVCQTHREHSQDRDTDTDPGEKNRFFQEQFDLAEDLRRKAAEAGAEWLQTEDLLIQSRKLAASEQWSAAMQLVDKACLQSELALQQSITESKAWKKRVID